MSSLDRKLLRDLWHMRGQVLAIALVIGAGVATLVGSLGTMHSLQETRAAYYERYRFADVFAAAKRVPEQLARRIADIPGVARVQTRIAEDVLLDVEGMQEPARARILSVPEDRPADLNRIVLREGRRLRPSHANEVIVRDAFADAHDLAPGDSITANINGKKRRLRIAGVALSPEFVYAIAPGELVPDNRRFGILWMGRGALEAAFDLKGAFNDVSLSVTRDASKDAVIARLDELLESFGGVGAYTRHDQVSDAYLRNEFDQLRTMTGIVPPIFLAVAAFLLNIVVHRLVETEREQIGLLKAFGYRDLAVGWHYLKLVLLVSLGGAAVGWAGGTWMGYGMTAMYQEYFRFPFLYFHFSAGVFATGALVSVFAATFGALFAVRRAVRLPPAVAMQPPPPTVYHANLAVRLGFTRRLSPPTRMIFRHIFRWPLRSALLTTGIAFSVALLVSSLFFLDAIDEMLEAFFFRPQRQDMTVTFVQGRSDTVRHDLRHLSGVLTAELYRDVPVRLRHGHRSRLLSVTGFDPDARLHRLVDVDDVPVELPPDGLVLTSKLAELLAVSEGDTVRLEALEGRRPKQGVEVRRIVREYVGTAAYMNRGALNRVLLEAPTASGARLLVDPIRTADLLRELKETPVVQGVTVQRAALDNFRRLVDQSMVTMVFFYVFFASLIAVGVVYNSARISLSERGRELASLRVLGFRQREVAYILLGELAILTVAAMPIGCVLGYGIAAIMARMFSSELMRLPLIILPSTYAFSILVVAAATAATAVLVARRLARLDLIAVLKTRE